MQVSGFTEVVIAPDIRTKTGIFKKTKNLRVFWWKTGDTALMSKISAKSRANADYFKITKNLRIVSKRQPTEEKSKLVLLEGCKHVHRTQLFLQRRFQTVGVGADH